MLDEACELKINAFYKSTIFELMTGTSARNIRKVMKEFEEEELYEECEGINRALKFYGKGKTQEELETEFYGKD